MNRREFQISKAILAVLHDMDGRQATETMLHGETNLRLMEPASLAEFNAAINHCDTSGWITGVQAKFGNGKKWNINDAGEAALLEM